MDSIAQRLRHINWKLAGMRVLVNGLAIALTVAVLPGITRHCVFSLARDFGIRIHQHVIPREALYVADEVFFSGTAAEITPVTKIDNIAIGDGKRGPVTERLQSEFFAIVEGRIPDRHNWFTYVS